MVMDVNQTYCGDHFAIYSYVESLCCTSETNIMLYVNYISIKKTSYKMAAVIGFHINKNMYMYIIITYLGIEIKKTRRKPKLLTATISVS